MAKWAWDGSRGEVGGRLYPLSAAVIRAGLGGESNLARFLDHNMNRTPHRGSSAERAVTPQ